jgi:hypothetical protein
MLAPPAGSQPLPRWARGTLSVPYRLGTPVYMLQVGTGNKAHNDTLPYVPWLQVPTPVLGGLQGDHVSNSTFPAPPLGKASVPPGAQPLRSHLPTQEGSDVATCLAAPSTVYPPEGAPVLSCGLRYWPPAAPTLEDSRGDMCHVASCVPKCYRQRATYARWPASHVTKVAMRITKANRHYGPTRRAAGSALNTYETCRQAATVPLQCSAILLTTHGPLLQCPVTPQYSVEEPLLCQVTQQHNALLRMGATWHDNKIGYSPRR